MTKAKTHLRLARNGVQRFVKAGELIKIVNNSDVEPITVWCTPYREDADEHGMSSLAKTLPKAKGKTAIEKGKQSDQVAAGLKKRDGPELSIQIKVDKIVNHVNEESSQLQSDDPAIDKLTSELEGMECKDTAAKPRRKVVDGIGQNAQHIGLLLADEEIGFSAMCGPAEGGAQAFQDLPKGGARIDFMGIPRTYLSARNLWPQSTKFLVGSLNDPMLTLAKVEVPGQHNGSSPEYRLELTEWATHQPCTANVVIIMEDFNNEDRRKRIIGSLVTVETVEEPANLSSHIAFGENEGMISFLAPDNQAETSVHFRPEQDCFLVLALYTPSRTEAERALYPNAFFIVDEFGNVDESTSQTNTEDEEASILEKIPL